MENCNQKSKTLFSITAKTSGKVLAFTVVAFPILFVYRTMIPSVSLADALLLTCIAMCLPRMMVRKVFLNNVSISSTIMFIYLILVLLVEAVGGYEVDVLLKYVRYLIYFYAAVILCPKYDCYPSAKRIYRILGCFTSLLIIVQYIGFYVFGRKISGYIPFLPIMGTKDWQTLQALSRNVSVYRPCSMFSEPAHYGAYAAGCLAISLGNDEDPTWVRILLTMGLMLSTSSTAIACGVFLWSVWLVHNNKITLRNMAIVLLMLVGFLLLMRSASIQYAIDRIFGTGMGVSGRFSSFSIMFEDMKSNPLGYLFGHCFTHEMVFTYIPGWGAFFYSFGIVGTVLLLYMMLQIWKKSNLERKLLLVVMSILSVGTLTLVSYNIMLYIGMAAFGLGCASKFERSDLTCNKRCGNC